MEFSSWTMIVIMIGIILATILGLVILAFGVVGVIAIVILIIALVKSHKNKKLNEQQVKDLESLDVPEEEKKEDAE